MLAVTASETIKLLESNPEVLTALRENTKVFRAAVDKSEYVRCTSAVDNPICLFVLRKEVVNEKGIKDAEKVMVDIVDEVCSQDSYKKQNANERKGDCKWRSYLAC